MQKPEKWSWFVFYCGTLALTYGLCVLGGIFCMVLATQSSGAEATELMFTGIALTVICLPFLVISVGAPFTPRKSWAYVFHILMIALGMTSCCWWPICIPLLIEWVKPETKAWYDGERYGEVFS